MTSASSSHAPVVHHLSQSVVERYAELSGDFNPLHVDPSYAAKTPFGRTVAHGPLVLQVFFDALLTWLDADAAPAGVRIQALFRNPTMSDATLSCHLIGIEVERDVATLSAECRTESTVAVAITASVPVPPGSPARAALLPG